MLAQRIPTILPSGIKTEHVADLSVVAPSVTRRRRRKPFSIGRWTETCGHNTSVAVVNSLDRGRGRIGDRTPELPMRKIAVYNCICDRH